MHEGGSAGRVVAMDGGGGCGVGHPAAAETEGLNTEAGGVFTTQRSVKYTDPSPQYGTM